MPDAAPPTHGLSQEPVPASAPKNRGARWLGLTAILCVSLFALLLGFGFWLTSDAGVRRVILPHLSKNFGMEITASRVAWHPFSSIEIENLRIGPAERPLLAAVRLSARYHGWAALLGRFEAETLQLESPSIHLVERPDGTFADMPKAFQPAAATAKVPTPVSTSTDAPPPLPVWVGNLSIRNLHLVHEAPLRKIEIGTANLSAQDLRPGGSATLDLDLGFSLKQEAPGEEGQEAHATTATGNARAKLAVNLDEALIPRSAKGELFIDRLAGHAGAERFEGFSATLHFDLGSGVNGKGLLREAALTVERAGTALATARATGPLDLAAREAELDMEIGPVGKPVLNLLFGARHMDFGPTQIGYTGHLSLRHDATLIRTKGRLTANPLMVSSPNLSALFARPIQISLDHEIEINLRIRQATISQLNLDTTRQGSGPLLKGTLNRPMTISWKEGENLGTPAEDAEFSLQLSPLEIAPFLRLLDLPPGWRLDAGTLAATLKITASEQGHLLSFDGRIGAAGIALVTPKISFTDAAAQVVGRTSLRDLKTLRFEKNSFRLIEKGEEIAEATLDGSWNLSAHAGAGRLVLSAPLPTLLALHPVADLAIPSGTASITAEWKLDATGRFVARTTTSTRNVSIVWQGIRYTRLAAQLDAVVGWGNPEFRANDTRLTLLVADQPTGILLANASWNARTGALRTRFEASDCRETAFAPLLAAWLPGIELRSLLFSGQGEVAWDAGTLSFDGKVEAKNLVIGGTAPSGLKPLNAGLSANLSWNTNGTLTLRSTALQLDPVGRAKNRVEASGVLKSTPSLLFANLKLIGQSLDLTPWYDQIFPSVATPSPATATPPSPSAAVPSHAPPTAPPALSRALDLTLDAKVDSLKVRDFTLANLVLPLRVKGNTIEVPDAHATLGGAPLSASVKTDKGEDGTPGPFRFESKVENLALGPLVETFTPSLRGQISGTLTGRIYGSGRGLSREMLDKNLDGNLELAIRDAHLEKLPSIGKALTRLGGILQSPDITASTVNSVEGSAKIASGKLSTDNLHVIGSALQVSLRGNAFFDQRLAMEATIKMNRAVMAKSSLLAPLLKTMSAERGDWLRLPGAATITGTFSEPQVALDTSKFVGETLINTGVNYLKQMLEKKQQPSQPAQPGQPTPPQQPPLQNLLDGLFKKK